jgi:hypothetical protein
LRVRFVATCVAEISTPGIAAPDPSVVVPKIVVLVVCAKTASAPSKQKTTNRETILKPKSAMEGNAITPLTIGQLFDPGSLCYPATNVAAPGNPWITGLDSIRKRAATPGVIELYEPRPEQGSAGCLAVIALLLFAFWLHNRSFQTAMGWLWLLLSGATAYVVAAREYSRTSILLEPNLLRITTGFAKFPRRLAIPPGQLSEIQVRMIRHSRQSTSSNTWYQSHRYQLALATKDGRAVPLFQPFAKQETARQAAQQLASIIQSEPALPINWKQPSPRLSVRTGFILVTTAAVVFFLIARAC